MFDEIIQDTISKVIRTKPINLSLLVTNLCNAQCVMCNIWQYGVSGKTDISLNQIKKILENPLLEDVYSVTLSGGEALIRKDIIDLVRIVIQVLPKVRRLFIATNGLATNLTVQKISQILNVIQEEKRGDKFRLTVQVSYDGVSETHDKIRGPNAHNNVTKTLENLNELRRIYPNLDLVAACVVQPLNLQEIDLVKQYLEDKDIPQIFPIVCTNGNYYKNETRDLLSFNESELPEVKRFYSKLVKEETRFGKKIMYWDFLRILNGNQSWRGCPVMRDTLFVEPDGNILPCLNCGEVTLGNAMYDDLQKTWFSKETRNKIKKISTETCASCMFACGVSYLDGLRYFIWDSWRKAYQ